MSSQSARDFAIMLDEIKRIANQSENLPFMSNKATEIINTLGFLKSTIENLESNPVVNRDMLFTLRFFRGHLRSQFESFVRPYLDELTSSN